MAETDPLIHLSSLHQAVVEAEAAIVAASLGVEAERSQRAASAALSAPVAPVGGGSPGA